MKDQETIDLESIEKNKKFVKIVNNNKIKIVLNENEIKFIIMIGISYYKYIRQYKYEEIIKELNIKDNIEKIYDYLVNSEYKIIEEEKKLIINDKNEIKLYEEELTDNEMIKVLIEEIKEIKYKNKEEIEKINKLNLEKIKNLENECKYLKEKINCIEQNINEEINLVYNM